MPMSARDDNPRRSLLPLKPIDLLVLIVLADGPQHGYALAQEIEARSQRRVRVRPGDLYRVLYRMTRAALIEPAAAPRREAREDERRAYYRITPLGRRAAREEAAYLQEVCAGLLGRRLRAQRS
jgi:DNA-binding PadR family transcriptional regulator